MPMRSRTSVGRSVFVRPLAAHLLWTINISRHFALLTGGFSRDRPARQGVSAPDSFPGIPSASTLLFSLKL